jgi:hypothetical protein
VSSRRPLEQKLAAAAPSMKKAAAGPELEAVEGVAPHAAELTDAVAVAVALVRVADVGGVCEKAVSKGGAQEYAAACVSCRQCCTCWCT